MKIAIIGTRGIPNNYGGFEQVTEYLSEGLSKKGHNVFVYNSHNHPYQINEWNGVNIVHCFDPEYLLKTPGQFIYDLNCILDARKRNFDVILFMGYTSSSIWRMFFPKKSLIISNMDGLEWQRTKYNTTVRSFLKYAEKLAVRHSHFYIVDSIEIQDYLLCKYNILCEYIPYGASLCRREKNEVLASYELKPDNYFLLMARMEPENNIDIILEGYSKSNSLKKFIVVGNTENKYGRKMIVKYKTDERIIFTGALFDQDLVHTLRKHACLYFHGHSVGGTNPSLLEAMASKTLIAAHDNVFNKAILQEDASYFTTGEDVRKIIEGYLPGNKDKSIDNNYRKIEEQYNWEKIIDHYDDFISNCMKKHEKGKVAFGSSFVYQ